MAGQTTTFADSRSAPIERVSENSHVETAHSRAETVPGQIGDCSPNVSWKAMTGNRSFSNPGAQQMLNDGLVIGDKPVLLADNDKQFGTDAHDWLRDKTKEAKERLEKATIHPIESVAKCVLDEFKSVLNDPNKDKGEFQWVIGQKEGKLFCSNKTFQSSESGLKIAGYEIHLSPTKIIPVPGFQVAAVMHTHPNEKGMDGEHFSKVDTDQADQLQKDNPNVTIRSYLLTPDNRVLAYTPKDKAKYPQGEEIGFFSKSGNFVETNPKFAEFKNVQQ